ncbi:hypothetical protein QFC22_006167 [Naganishia vaughanmartiniae]|uniref:Uncharacterized protein n=1 Tax=Naganishia vaughanmartiniae TaxID=1424756 RepID=A0ACC2WNC9_9TREE|nr:hypothetical protein QFC22_006167 [Naganishia vaughanmartiniae]
MSPIDSSLAQEPSLPPLNSSNGAPTTITKPTSRATISLDTYDEEQVRLMEERCILVTPQDKQYGEACKKTCHLMANIRGPESLLHRAFSVFLFRPTDGRLLLQKRAAEKITFPNMWTNTCCSHPLSTANEREETGQMGVRRAACRKLPQELGTKDSELDPTDFTYLTRIHYLAPCEVDEKTGEEGVWGEHEIDYILFATKDVTLDLNPNEVSDATYVNEQELRAMFDDSGKPARLPFSFYSLSWSNLSTPDTQSTPLHHGSNSSVGTYYSHGGPSCSHAHAKPDGSTTKRQTGGSVGRSRRACWRASARMSS